MVAKNYDNAREFLTKYEPILIEKEQVSQLILDTAYQSINTSPKEWNLFGAIEENEEAQLFYCIKEPHNLIMYAPGQDKSMEASLVLADFFGSSHIILYDMNARPDICQSFITRYKKQKDCTFIQSMESVIMEVRKVNDIKPIEGLQRLAFQEEAKLITDWMIRFQLETLASEMDYEDALKKANVLIKEGKVYFYLNSENKVVTMAVAVRKIVHGMTIGYVFTPEEYRGKGYAAANLYFLSKALLEQGYEFCTLFADKKNPLTNRAYEKIGYKNLEEHYKFSVIQKEQ